MRLIYQNDKLYCSYSFLEQFIPKKTIEDWKQRGICERIYQDGNAYIDYDTTPTPSRSKLPSKSDLIYLAKQAKKEEQYNRVKQIFLSAIDEYKSDFINELNRRFGNKLEGAYKIHIATKASCFKKYFEVKRSLPDQTTVRRVINELCGIENKDLDYTFIIDIREKYQKSHNECFCILKSKIVKSGYDYIGVLVDTKKHSSNRKGVTSFEPHVWDRITYFLSDDRKFNSAEVYSLVTEELHQSGLNYKVPCSRFIKKRLDTLMKDHKFRVERLGEKEAAKYLPNQLFEKVKHTNQLWYIDGWVLPFWVNGDKKFERWVLVRVIDVCSGFILSYKVGKSENTELIMGALKDAIATTGCIPTQLVMDKHSASKTLDYKHFEATAWKLGCNVINTHKATDKPEIERHNKYLNSILKIYPEWLGEGISAKLPTRRAEETYKELAKTKNQLTPNEVTVRALAACEKFNTKNTSLNKGKTPNAVFEQTESKGIQVDYATQIQLMTDPKKYIVRHHQITIYKGGLREIYTLPVGLTELEGQKVTAHYEDFGGEIYLFDKEGNCLTSLQPAKRVSKILNERREEQQKPKTLGTKKGIVSQSEKNGALADHPENLKTMPSTLIQKDAFTEIQSSSDLQQFAKRENLKPEKTHKPLVHVVGESQPHVYNPDIEDNEVADLKPFNIFDFNNNYKKE